MDWSNGYIINPDDFRNGQLLMSPFTSGYQFRNHKLWSNFLDDGLPYVTVDDRKFYITPSGTSALEAVLNQINPAPENEVWIVTTSGNHYISGCVTRTIEKFCRWSRQKTEKTKAILVNHEFGFVHDEVEKLTAHHLPLIEDCAYSMYSGKNGKKAGTVGDFAIFSMAKMFPVQAGGLIVSNRGLEFSGVCETNSRKYFKACFHYYQQQSEQIIDGRLKNFRLFEEKFGKAGLETRFEPQVGEVPGAFLFKAPGWPLDELKIFLQKQGIECSVFYGEDAFYLPCHQNMNVDHINYILTLIKFFKK
ncbi:DegT/DnrJ/EryC1/StrS family aminotransferase [Natronoflexus pectinivorans]|uniref:dTDP-4-amino-4,6-dideoxygalactose transaminase n=1 Tax=Natronoflexus pectinivorans TaxID=682526 RepID=A0A4R2GFA8_9BACT|nr:DegT/DnrJ/EryC1/StrS family aminotransferase [Natronoflexus pectinivorans]TCO06847.1 dTDP-4-amino-4,6-dideoxygalactose transaminase [Natronoflexus pectinivorans]